MDKKKLSPEEKMKHKIQSDAAKKIKAKTEKDDIMFGLGVFGIVGWSIAIPTLMGVAAGAYLDNRFPTGFSWTLTLLFAGILAGCFNAWHWVKEKSGEE
ncbi:AtpZ/AtpI family protein [Anoxynatronum buryatiense]|uniref:ATP synthase protein I n=1 Tax=Anoxynatronum buryatiense TaxID=489973 RepID=A0AA45WV71_9CLOT|nr:AtpZ/AtpI family protein [Anoxynatronum buryatiense]SMP52085.1 ATP synthase protein I [Anoxynatronum buryatiense]